MINKIKIFVFDFVWIILSLYIILIIDTHNLMIRAKKIFFCEISENEIEDKLSRYSLGKYINKNEIGNIELRILRPFTIHNFNKGIIIIKYTHVIYDRNGEILTGSWNIFPVIWKIRKINNVWNVIEIDEAP